MALSRTDIQSNGPRHVAIIMDGNGRWATSRGMPRIEGHRRGIRTVRAIVDAAGEIGLPYLTLFGFSAENWSRPDDEISSLMALLRLYLASEQRRLHSAGVRLNVIGDITRLPADIVDGIDAARQLMSENAGLVLTIALSYGGRQDIVAAARRLAARATAGEIEPAAIDEALFSRTLDTGDMPDPDLVIRTSGEQRISNFLLWQSAYSEYVFPKTLWPDYSADGFLEAIGEYQTRERRFGAVPA